jgi:uncharacterized protein (DUF58 family)
MPETKPPESQIGLLTPLQLKSLERRRFSPGKRFAGQLRGERLSKKKGVSIEFSDFRDYAPGDDLRHLDWNILARLNRPTIRTYQDEDDLAIYLLLDSSASMDFGTPSKFETAKILAAALGFIGLTAQDAVYPVMLGNGASAALRAMRGRASFMALNRWAESGKPEGGQGFASSLSDFARSARVRQGIVVVISDCFDANAASALRAVAARGHEIAVVQLLSPLEIDPDIEGDLRLIDSESGETTDITATSEALRIYKENLDSHCSGVEQMLKKIGGKYLKIIANNTALDETLSGLRRLGMIE